MDLLSSRPFWPIRDGLPASFPALEMNATCDVAIIGGGITGAMIAWLLTVAGLEVVVLDRREVAHGSTAGNTGLILYELDVPLHQLARRFGRDRAERAVRRCRAAVRALESLVRDSEIACGFSRKTSLYVAAKRAHVPALEREFAARRAAGLAVEWWPRRRISAESSLPHHAAILSKEAAQADVYRLTYGLLMAARSAGACVHDRTEVTSRRHLARGVELVTSRGSRVRCRELVIASGYEAEAMLPRRFGRLQSTFVLISEPMAEFAGWPDERCVIWDTADPYLYLRTTADNRALIGGYDENFTTPAARDRQLTGKVTRLKRRFRQLFPAIPLEVASAWAGTFGVSADGLPYIGRHASAPHTWLALGFGGNGTTFSLVAAEMIRDAMIGEPDPDAPLFDLGRVAELRL